MIDARSPPDSNSADRLTVATPSWIDRPSSFVRAGMSVYIAGRALISASLGPREQLLDGGGRDGLGRRELAQHGREAGVVGEAAEEEVRADDGRVARTLGGFGVLVGAAVGSSVGGPRRPRTGRDGSADAVGWRWARGSVTARRGPAWRRPSGPRPRGCPWRAAWPACRGRPTPGRRRRPRRAASARMTNGLGRRVTSTSVVRVPMRRQRPFRACRRHRARVTVRSRAG